MRSLDTALGIDRKSRTVSWRKPKRGATQRKVFNWRELCQVWLLRLRWISGLLMLCLIVCAGFFGVQHVLQAPQYPVRHIVLQGEHEFVPMTALQSVVKPLLGTSFLTLPLYEIQHQLRQEPWLRKVTVSKRWPDTVVVQFEEQRPFARWGQDELVDEQGVRFKPSAIPDRRDWVSLAGPSGQENRVLTQYHYVQQHLAPIGLQVVRLVQDSRHAWYVTLSNGTELLLGARDFESRLQRFIDYYPDILSVRIGDIRRVDLRYPNGFSIKWRSIDVMRSINETAQINLFFGQARSSFLG